MASILVVTILAVPVFNSVMVISVVVESNVALPEQFRDPHRQIRSSQFRREANAQVEHVPRHMLTTIASHRTNS